MTDIIQLIIAGVSAGSIYGIIALAFTTIYNSTKIVNFAQGNFIMLGSMLAYYFMALQKLPITVAIILIVTLTGLIGLSMKIFIIDSLEKREAPLFSKIIATLAVGIILSQSAALIFGKTKYSVPPLIKGDPIKLFSTNIGIWPENIILIIITFGSVIGFWIFLNHTSLGRVIRAIGYNPKAAKIAGIQTSKIIAITFILSGGISALGGIIVAPIVGASPYMGMVLGVKGFSATILGGMGNPFAGFIGGIILGLVEAFGSYYISFTYAPVIAYVILLGMLMIKPTGLWPEKEAR